MPQVLFYALPLIVFGLAIGFLYLRRERLREVLVTLARRRNGRVVKGPMGLYPLGVFGIEGAEIQVSGIHGSRHGRATCTFAWVGCDGYPDLSLEVRRKPQRVGLLERLGQEEANTGHHRFDEAFWMHAEDGDAARDLLDEELRGALLEFDPGLRVRLRVGELLAFPDGWRTGKKQRSLEVALRRLPADLDDVERLLDVARLVHERLVRRADARAA